MQKEPSSFRDRSGCLYFENGVLFRRISSSYAEHFDFLRSSGLLEELLRKRLLVFHETIQEKTTDSHAVLRPEMLSFISYPYEWSFSQLKDAALLTLDIQELALAHGMVLKDASAYNVQFRNGRPVFIDILSFEKYIPGAPWIAYRQFCQHFLAPLALAAHTDVCLIQLLRNYIDGIPLELTCTLLPRKTLLSSLFFHLYLHASQQKKYEGVHEKEFIEKSCSKLPLHQLRAIVDSLRTAVRKLQMKKSSSEWADYYHMTNYTEPAKNHKSRIINEFIAEAAPGFVVDLGSNTGLYSRLASSRGIPTISADIDPLAVEANYLTLKNAPEEPLLPLLIDLTNPSPALGWANEERRSFLERLPRNSMVFSLALIHHLAISNNVPLDRLSSFFSAIAQWLIMEFVPKSDSQVKKLLSTREDIFPDYSEEGFEQAFAEHFEIKQKKSLETSERTMYLLRRK